MSFTVLSRDGSSPVTLAEAKAQSRIVHDSEDSLIQSYITASIELCESHTQKIVQLSTVKSYFEDGETAIELNRPVRAINAIKYIDADGAEQSITADYTVLSQYDNGVLLSLDVVPDYQQIWVEYVAGYDDYTVTGSELEVINSGTLTVPTTFKIACLMLVSHMYNNREAVSDFQRYELPMGVKHMLDSLRYYA